MCKDLYVGNLSSSPGEEYFWSDEQPQATMPPLWPIVGTGCAPVGLKADRHSAFLVNFVIIGENICQHTLSEHKCSIEVLDVCKYIQIMYKYILYIYKELFFVLILNGCPNAPKKLVSFF